jgi:transcription antitermination factor NusA-like protein
LVKTLLDNFCVKSGVLCARCEEKLRKGQITDLDLKIVRILFELEKQFPMLQDVSFERAVESGDVLAILVSKQDVGKMLSSGGKIVRAIGKETRKRVKILGYGGDSRQLIEDLFSPISILTINTIWLPDDTRETKVILDGRRPKHVPVDFEIAKRLAKEISGMTLRVEFEGR